MRITDRDLQRIGTDPAIRDKVERALASQMIEGMLSTAVAHGRIDPAGKSPAELTLALAALIHPLDETKRLTATIDHAPKLLELGRKAVKEKQLWIAAMLFATWVEHRVNYIVCAGLYRRGLSDAQVRQAIRSLSFEAKLTWFLRVLDFPPIAEEHVKRLRELADLRNEFVHYKWAYVDLDAKRDERLTALMGVLPATVKYLSAYEPRVLLKGAAKCIRDAARR